VLSCYKEILQEDKNNAGWSPKKFAEHKIFMDGGRPFQFLANAHTQNVKFLFGIL
jgi:hypothetical protein